MPSVRACIDAGMERKDAKSCTARFIPRVVGIEPFGEGEAPSEPSPIPAGSHRGSPSLPRTSLGRARLRPSLLRSPPARTEARPPFPERRMGGRGSVRAFSDPRRLAQRLALPSQNVAWEGEAPSEPSPIPAGSHRGSPSLPRTSHGRARLRPSLLRSPPARTEARPPFPERRMGGRGSVRAFSDPRRLAQRLALPSRNVAFLPARGTMPPPVRACMDAGIAMWHVFFAVARFNALGAGVHRCGNTKRPTSARRITRF